MDNQTVINCFLISTILLYVGMAYLGWELYRLKGMDKEQNVSRLVHLGTSLEPIQELELKDVRGLVIGKRGGGAAPDFDLSSGDTANAVAVNHAVLNLVEGAWYIESLEKNCNVGLKKAGESVVYRLKTWTPYKVDPGDMIYIARERLLLK